MLLYNWKKEFIGIDKNYLDIFNISTLSELQNIHKNFESFFEKSPGYIHDFLHVHWIDYVLAEDSQNAQKVLINIKDEQYTANLEINILYLSDEPEQKSYAINLTNLRSVNESLEEKRSCDVGEVFFDHKEINYDEKSIEIPELPVIEEIKEVIIQDTYEEPAIKVNASVMDKVINTDTYKFDPSLASLELGLPIDLVEEFVEDFIAQAKDFKNDIYESIEIADLNRVKTQSHKLKGVAANLRIHNALDILTRINNSDDFLSIQKNIDIFYKIIDRLEEHDFVDSSKVNIIEKTIPSNDDLVLNFK